VRLLRHDLHVLTGGYVLDALTELERKDFERHLHHCASCDAEVRGLRETAARLAMAKARRPPAQMEQRVLAAAHRTRQLPPRACDRPGRDHRRARTPRLFVAIAAVSVAAAIALGVTQAVTRHRLESARASGAVVTRVVAAPDARIETTRTSVGGTVTVVVSARQRAAVVIAAGMASLASGRVYQVWVMSPSGARSAGLLSVTSLTGPLLASGVLPADRIGITVEPSGGTSSPTTAPVVVMPLREPPGS